MKTNKKYQVPRIYAGYMLATEGSVLAGSVFNDESTVETQGQEVVDYDFSGDEFNADWD